MRSFEIPRQSAPSWPRPARADWTKRLDISLSAISAEL
jgi:predicted alpha/beta hydrolase family esterase